MSYMRSNDTTDSSKKKAKEVLIDMRGFPLLKAESRSYEKMNDEASSLLNTKAGGPNH